MAWYDPTTWGTPGRIAGAIATGGFSELNGRNGLAGQVGVDPFSDPAADTERQRKEMLYRQAAGAGSFADQQQQVFGAGQQMARGNIETLQALAAGRNSVSAEQLRQALGRNQATQQSIAAGAAPQNAAAAARTAAIQSARLGAGLSGQQALAGLQERNAAQSALTGAIGQYGSQALQATDSARGQAIQGYGAGNTGAPEKSWLEKYGPAIQSGAALAASDRRLKTDVRDGDKGAAKMLDGLRAFTYRYKDGAKHGEGERTGIMAQDLERAGIKHAVVDTPGGKMVHGAHLATANTAMIAGLHKRLKAIEGKA